MLMIENDSRSFCSAYLWSKNIVSLYILCYTRGGPCQHGFMSGNEFDHCRGNTYNDISESNYDNYAADHNSMRRKIA